MFGHCINTKITCVCKHLTDFCFFHPIIFIYLYLEESKFILAREGSLFQCWADKHPPILNNRSTIAPLWSPCTPTVQKTQGLINVKKERQPVGLLLVEMTKAWREGSIPSCFYCFLPHGVLLKMCPHTWTDVPFIWLCLCWHMSPHRSNWYATLGGQGGCTYISLIIL